MRLFILSIIMLLCISCASVETQTVTKTFTWTAVDADAGSPAPNPTGRACSHYDFRITVDSAQLINDWAGCQGGVLSDIPPLPGVKDTVQISGFNPTTTYWCAVKSGDNGQWSVISNIIKVVTEDLGTPGKIIDLDQPVTKGRK